MTTDDFRHEMQADFPPPDPVLYALAEEYQQRCESYDRKVCSAVRDGVAMPTSARELGLVNRNAALVLRDLKNRTADHEGLRRAIRRVGERF